MTVWVAEGEGGGRGGTSPSGLLRGREPRGAPPQLAGTSLSLSLSPAGEDENMSCDSTPTTLSSGFSGGSEFILVLLLGGLDIPAGLVTLGTHLKIV